MARNKYAIARYSIWYILRILIVSVAVILLIMGVFSSAMHMSNIYIILVDGMDLRAECILQDGSVLELSNYFTENFLNRDEKLLGDAYSDFTVSSFDYRLEIERLLALPWSEKVEVQVVEKLVSVAYSNNADAADAELPAWATGRYRITFVKENIPGDRILFFPLFTYLSMMPMSAANSVP